MLPPSHHGLQAFFIVIVSGHPRSGCSYANELLVLGLLGIPTILGLFEFKRPPRTDADVANYKARSSPFESQPRRFGQTITGVLPDNKASLHTAEMLRKAEALRQVLV